MGENIPIMLTGMLRPHRTRQTEDHSDEPGTDCFTFHRTQKEKYSTDMSGKKSAVNAMNSSVLAVNQLRKQENTRQLGVIRPAGGQLVIPS